ncbi:hypothetical protein [Streptomyces aureus]
MLTVNVTLLLAVIVVWRLRRRTEARSRFDEKLTVVIVLALGVLIAPTPAGQGILNVLGQLARRRHPGQPVSPRTRMDRTAPAGGHCGARVGGVGQ